MAGMNDRAAASPASRRPTIPMMIRFYFRLQLVQLRTAIEYNADFWIGIAGATITQLSGLVFISALFSQVPEVEGWTVWEIALIYAMALVPKGITELFCDGPWALRMLVNSGQFDRLLVRPLPASLQTATQIASIHGVGQTGLGIVVFAMASSRAGIDWTAGKALLLAMVLVSSVVMIGAINFLVNMIAFWEPSTESSIPTLFSIMIDFAKFPLDIYNLFIRGLITIVIPYAFISYFPALVLLDKDSSARWLGYLTPVASALVVAVTAFLWNRGINRYQGVGH
jgi:ABC-2 type transport system permease protein